MKFGYAVIILVLMGVWLVTGQSVPAKAAPAQQQYATNTPLPDGRIVYKVLPGDTCTKIQLLYAISMEQLRELNPNLNADCTISEGQELLIGIGGPAPGAVVAPGPTATAGPPTPTPTPFVGTTEICVLLFDDLNGDALRQTDETVIVGGAISVTETSGLYSKTLETSINPDPNAYPGVCFSDVPEGTYNIGAAIPDNYNPTMSLTYTLNVKAGDRAFVDFGAQSRETTSTQPGGGQSDASFSSPLLGILGGFLLLSGIGLGWYALRLRNPRGRLKGSQPFRR